MRVWAVLSNSAESKINRKWSVQLVSLCLLIFNSISSLITMKISDPRTDFTNVYFGLKNYRTLAWPFTRIAGRISKLWWLEFRTDWFWSVYFWCESNGWLRKVYLTDSISLLDRPVGSASPRRNCHSSCYPMEHSFSIGMFNYSMLTTHW